MIDLQSEYMILMSFIDGVFEGKVNREIIEQRVKIFATMVAHYQREACALWIEDERVMDCRLATKELEK